MLLEEFRRTDITVDGIRIAVWTAGEGPPVLLLHGYPQSHVMWHAVAPALARDHTVVLPDLRGYGDSDKPGGDPDHARYSKRAMAADQVGVMAELGFERFALVGHDRGGRVAHRLTLDHPDRVSRLCVVDIAPTHHSVVSTDLDMARTYFHWYFLAQDPPLPEQLIGAAPDAWLSFAFRGWHGGGRSFDPEALAAYRAAWTPETIAASCEDYRAALTIDLETDEFDRDRRVECPLLAVWGERAFVGNHYDPVAVWSAYATDVRGVALPTGHFVPEEAPEDFLATLRQFLANGGLTAAL